MNVFENLIEELRDENLLEETVIDLRPSASKSFPPESERASSREMTGAAGGHEAPIEEHDLAFDDADTPADGRDFYRKRAMDEVSSLQMVEHVLSGIEREYLKVIPATYDDLQAKKALHQFLQVQGEPDTTDYAEAEFSLMQETEAWSTALSDRDSKISVSYLRQFCENSRPVLSSQALIALGRFYRNASFSELSRAKFDLIMTRLFSRDSDDEKRRLLFSRVDMIGHLKTLYANWSSIALFSAEDDAVKIRAAVTAFDDRVSGAEKAETFEALIKNAFFDQIHEFKASTGEMFFTPEVVAAAIDANVRIGNIFVDLIRLERETTTFESVERKYGFEYDQIITDAAGKTLQLIEVLKNAPESEAGHTDGIAARPDKLSPAKKGKASSDLFRVNKWLLALTIAIVLAGVGVFFFSADSAATSTAAESANDVDLGNSELAQYVRSGRSTDETFYAITLPTWDQLSEDKKKEVLQMASAFAAERGLINVRLVNVRGNLEAFGLESRLEVLHPTP